MAKEILMAEQERVGAFLADLAELSMKYGLAVGGCGCCGSPWIGWLPEPNMDGSILVSRLEFDVETRLYKAWKE